MWNHKPDCTAEACYCADEYEADPVCDGCACPGWACECDGSTEREEPVFETEEAACRKRIWTHLASANVDELRVVLFICDRVIGLGHESYGFLNLAADRRDGREELSEEVVDAFFYVGFHVLQERLRRKVQERDETTKETEPAEAR